MQGQSPNYRFNDPGNYQEYLRRHEELNGLRQPNQSIPPTQTRQPGYPVTPMPSTDIDPRQQTDIDFDRQMQRRRQAGVINNPIGAAPISPPPAVGYPDAYENFLRSRQFRGFNYDPIMQWYMNMRRNRF